MSIYDNFSGKVLELFGINFTFGLCYLRKAFGDIADTNPSTTL